MTIALFILAWLACGVVAAGYQLATFEKDRELSGIASFAENRSNAQKAILLGVMAFTLQPAEYWTKHGWLWPWSAKAKREAGL